MRRISKWAFTVFNHAKKYQNDNGYITDTNEQLADFYDTEVKLIAKAVAELEKVGYVDVVFVGKERRVFIEES